MLDLRSFAPLTLRSRIADLRGRGPYAGYPNDFRCIYIHVPKTAGISISNSLFETRTSHKRYLQYLQANPSKFKEYFKFSFVRNPWDRVVSSYFFLILGGMNEMDRDWSDKNLRLYRTFDEFVRNWLNETNIATWVHFRPQTYFIADEFDTIMVDFVGRYERLSEDFEFVARRLGRSTCLPMSNTSPHANYTTYYNDETRAIVGRVYARDIRLFGYTFER